MWINVHIGRIALHLHLGGYRRWDIVRNHRQIALYGFRSKLGASLG